MINWIRQQLRAWKEQHRRQHEMAGWDWAAGELLRGASVEEVEGVTDFFNDDFDRGARAAVLQWQDLCIDPMNVPFKETPHA